MKESLWKKFLFVPVAFTLFILNNPFNRGHQSSDIIKIKNLKVYSGEISPTNADIKALSVSPESDWADINKTQRVIGKDREWLWLKASIPDLSQPDISAIFSTCSVVRIYADTELIYTFGEPGAAINFTRYYQIKLPPKSQGKQLYFHIYVKDSGTQGITGLIFGQDTSLVRNIFVKDSRFYFLGFFYWITGIAAGIIFLFNRKMKEMLGILIISLSMSVTLINLQTHVFFLYPHPYFWMLLTNFAFLIPLGFNMYFTQSFGKIKYVMILDLLFIFLTVFMLTASFFPSFYQSIYEIVLIVYFIFLLIDCVYLVIASWKRKEFNQSYILKQGLLISTLCTLFDIIMMLIGFAGIIDLGDYRSLSSLGIVFFILAMGISALQRINSEQQRLAGYTQELEIARKIQNSILPIRNPQIKGISLSSLYLPMREVGGDMFEFRKFSEARTGILIADVSGHGVPAALIASMVNIVFSVIGKKASDPAQVLDQLNNAMYDNMENQFVTAQFATIDTDQSQLQLAGAGHPPALLYRRSEHSLHELKPTGRMIGLFPDSEYKNSEWALSAGDRIILYTDGITESENIQGVQFGDGAFQEMILDYADRSTEDLVHDLPEKLRQWTGKAEFEDDITLVILEMEK